MTNADRIRAMTDEEMAERLEYLTCGCDYMACVAQKYCDGMLEDYCRKAWLDWLKEEANDDTGRI